MFWKGGVSPVFSFFIMSVFLIFVISSLLPCHSRPVIFRSSSFLVIPVPSISFVIPRLDRGIPRLPDQVRQWQREKSLDPDISLIYPRNALRPRTTLVWMPGLNPNMTEKTSKTERKKEWQKGLCSPPAPCLYKIFGTSFAYKFCITNRLNKICRLYKSVVINRRFKWYWQLLINGKNFC